MIKGIQIWANSNCRSVLAFYREIGKCCGVPIKICLARVELGTREGLGWSVTEFDDLEIIAIGDDLEKAQQQLNTHKDWHQIFGVYQIFPVIQKMLLDARKLGCSVGVCSEAPLNMFEPSLRRFAKDLFLSKILPRKLKPYIVASDFIVNFSGDSTEALRSVGWRANQIIPLGYCSPPLEGSEFCERSLDSSDDFHILCTGKHTWHRGQDVLLNALVLLKKWRLNFRVTVTQSGPLFEQLKSIASKYDLPVDFPKMVPIEELIDLYQTCSVYVGTGRAEPWGLRVNDALHCGAPLLVSSGMGVHKVINEHACGLVFHAGDFVDLAWKLRKLIEDRESYQLVSERVRIASRAFLPSVAAERVVGVLSRKYTDWGIGLKND